MPSRQERKGAEHWRTEAACRRAWPAAEEREAGAWTFRRSGGSTRRTNSVNPVEASEHDIATALSDARAFYAQRGQPLLFRVPSFLSNAAAQLEQAGFQAEGFTSTLTADLGANAQHADAETLLSPRADDEWVAAKRRLTPTDDEQQEAFETMLRSIERPARFARLAADGAIRSAAYGVVDDGMLVLEAVVTDVQARGRGFAHRVVASLMAWARSEGADRACLQVVSDNRSALRLYRRLGFDRLAYTYAYYRDSG